MDDNLMRHINEAREKRKVRFWKTRAKQLRQSKKDLGVTATSKRTKAVREKKSLSMRKISSRGKKK